MPNHLIPLVHFDIHIFFAFHIVIAHFISTTFRCSTYPKNTLTRVFKYLSAYHITKLRENINSTHKSYAPHAPHLLFKGHDNQLFLLTVISCHGPYFFFLSNYLLSGLPENKLTKAYFV